MLWKKPHDSFWTWPLQHMAEAEMAATMEQNMHALQVVDNTADAL